MALAGGPGGVVDRRDTGVGVPQSDVTTLRQDISALHREARTDPGADAAVQHPDVHAAAPQQPPRPRGRDRIVVVVDDDQVAVVHPPASGGVLQVRQSRERVPADLGVPGLGKLALEVDVDGAGQVPRDVGGSPLRRIQSPPHIEQAHRTPRIDLGREFVSVDEQGHTPSLRTSAPAVAAG